MKCKRCTQCGGCETPDGCDDFAPDWMPIESASTDDEILGLDKYGNMFVCYWSDVMGRWRLCNMNPDTEDFPVNPTQWQPLPKPPKKGN